MYKTSISAFGALFGLYYAYDKCFFGFGSYFYKYGFKNMFN